MFFVTPPPSSLQVILSRQYGSEGRFTFTSHTPGEHQICLHSNSSKFSLFAGGMLVRLRPLNFLFTLPSLPTPEIHLITLKAIISLFFFCLLFSIFFSFSSSC